MTNEQLWQGRLSDRRTVPADFLAFSAGLEVRHRENTPRAREGEQIDEKALTALIQAAIELNTSRIKK